MASQDWLRARDLFERALAVPSSQRQRFLEEACAGDEAMHRQVLTLLGSHDEAAGFLEKPADAPMSAVFPNRDLSGTRLGPYLLDSRLGAGGMGEVFRARDTRLGRTVASKVLPVHLAEDRPARERFEREARTLAALHHPHICAVYD